MQTKKKRLIISLLCALGVVAMLFVALVVPTLVKGEEVSETEFRATVLDVEKKDKDYFITTEEYPCRLFVDGDLIITEDKKVNIQFGEEISFKVRGIGENALEDLEIDQIAVVTLRTQMQEIISLDSYQQKEKQSMQIIQTTGVTAAVLFGMLMLFNLYLLSKKK